MQCHAGGNVIFGNTGKFVSIVFLTVRQTDKKELVLVWYYSSLKDVLPRVIMSF